MENVFDAFLTDPLLVDTDVFLLWLQGYSVELAVDMRLRKDSAEKNTKIEGASRDALSQWKSLFRRDTVDQYRLFDALEHYLRHPSSFFKQNIFQIPLVAKNQMITEYFAFDETVVRYLLGRKLTTKNRKHLDDISEVTNVMLRSCLRQFDNLRRIYSSMDDRNFRGNICQSLKESFHFPDNLAWKYTCALFLLHGRFEVHPSNKRTSFLTWNDLEYISSVIMQNWLQGEYIAESSLNPENSSVPTMEGNGENNWESELQRKMELAYADISSRADGISLDMGMTNRLRDIKTYMINDSNAMTSYVNAVLERIQISLGGPVEQYSTTIKIIARGLFVIAERLSHPQELKNLFEDLVELIGKPLVRMVTSIDQLDIVFEAFTSSLKVVPSWYLRQEQQSTKYTADWSRFVEVCRICIQHLFTRL